LMGGKLSNGAMGAESPSDFDPTLPRWGFLFTTKTYCRGYCHCTGRRRTKPSGLVNRSGNTLLDNTLRPICVYALATRFSAFEYLPGGKATTTRFLLNMR